MKIGKAQTFEDSGLTLMAYIVGSSGQRIAQADISAIDYSVWDAITNTQVLAPQSLVVADVLFDSLQTDCRWEQAAPRGYNFRFDVPANGFPTGCRDARVEVKFTPASGYVFHAVWSVEVVPLFRS